MKLAAIKGIRRFHSDKLLPLLTTTLSDNDTTVRTEAFSAIRDVLSPIFGDKREAMLKTFYEVALSDAERDTLDEIVKLVSRPVALGIDNQLLKREAKAALEETTREEWTPTATVRQPLNDAVWFSVTAPAQLEPGTMCLLDVWAHGPRQEWLVLERARGALLGRRILQRGVGPVAVASGAQLNVVLEDAGFRELPRGFNLDVGRRDSELLVESLCPSPPFPAITSGAPMCILVS